MRCAFVTTAFATLVFACGTTTPIMTDGTGPLFLDAYGGPAGQVGAAAFVNEPGVGPDDTCATPVTAGACQLTSCTFAGGIGDPGLGYGNFGPIFVTIGGTTVPMPYADEGYPTIGFPSSVALGTGGIMKFHGEGGTTDPSFDISATIPGIGVITAPVPTTAGGATLVDTTLDLTVTWMPISIGEIQFELSAGGDVSPVSVGLACTFPGSAGSGVVPQTLLSSLKMIAGAYPTYGTLGSELQAMTVVDGLTIVTTSYQSSSPPAGNQFDVTLR